MNASFVQIPVDHTSMPTYVAMPTNGTGPYPAIIVLEEIFGINAEMRRIADLFASIGYVAVAPNYYHRTEPDLDAPYNEEGMKRGFAAAAKTTRATLRADLQATIAWLKTQSQVDASRIATCGFCMGGTVAFFSATLPDIHTAIAFYGGSIAAPMASGEPEMLTEAEALHAPLLLLFGGKDTYITEEMRTRIAETLAAHGKPFSMHVYPDEGHGFFRQSSEALERPSVADAWQRVQAALTAKKE